MLVTIEGTDGSGKAEQTKLLCNNLKNLGYKVKQLEFPRYKDDSSTLVRMYLRGELGENPDDVNPFASSTFYALDRYVSYVKDWRDDYYSDDTIIVSDRYTMSNAIHQGLRFQDNSEELDNYLRWLFDFEFLLLKLPEPDIVIYLDLPTELSQRLIHMRESKTDTKSDILEEVDYQRRSRKQGLMLAERFHWFVINCATHNNKDIRTVEEINNEMLSYILANICYFN